MQLVHRSLFWQSNHGVGFVLGVDLSPRKRRKSVVLVALGSIIAELIVYLGVVRGW